MTTPNNNTPSPAPAPRLPKSSNKSHGSAAGLLGRTGSGGGGGGSLGLNSVKLAPAIPTGDALPKHATPSHADANGPAPAAKHIGKPETRRPTGRAISGS